MTNKIINITNNFDSVCNYCIDLLEEVSSTVGMSYGELNVWLFVIIQPALIILFITTTVTLAILLYRKIRSTIALVAVILLVLAYAVVLVMSFIILAPIYLLL